MLEEKAKRDDSRMGKLPDHCLLTSILTLIVMIKIKLVGRNFLRELFCQTAKTNNLTDEADRMEWENSYSNKR